MEKVWNPSNRKVLLCNIITALFLDLFLELMERKSAEQVLRFINDRTFVFLFNMLILFVCLSLVFIAKKKLFVWAAVTAFWLIVGTINGLILNTRKTPFTAVDITLTRSILPIISSYLKVWQIVGAVILIIVGVILLVTLYLYSPAARKSFDPKVNMALFLLQMLIFWGITYVAVGRGMLISKFDNLIAGYKDYGVAYGFCVTALDTGIDRPIDYSSDKMNRIGKKIDRRIEEKNKKAQKKGAGAARTPNIIFIQLESFFDLTTVKDLKISEDPLPVFHRLQKEYTSGYLKVPVYGAGTINTEFEVISGMNTGYFGTGEYPYRSILQDHTCDSMAYWLQNLPYDCTVIHNNNASFYDRDHVLTNLGFDHFITIENMNAFQKNEAGWAKDAVLTGEILETLGQTADKDLIYTISVQGHGDYPSDPMEDARIKVDYPGADEAYINQLIYYCSQINEMDAFIGDLTDKLSTYPEETIVVIYGDHLPGMDFTDKDLTSGSKYKTPYIIWDNFGYNSKNREKESEDLKAYQIASKVFEELKIRDGVMNRFHQTMRKTGNYKKNLKLMQYDILYGSDFISRYEGVSRKQTDMDFCLRKISIKEVRPSARGYYILGENFTPESRVYINGRAVKTNYHNRYLLEIPSGSLRNEDELVIHQVSQTNENITLNVSEPFIWYKDVRK